MKARNYFIVLIFLLGCGGNKTSHKENENMDFNYSRFSSLVHKNDLNSIRELKNLGVKIDSVNQFGFNLMHGATSSEMVHLLVEYGVNINQQSGKDTNMWTPLHGAVYGSNIKTEVVKAMLDSGADPSIEDRFGKKPVDYARELASQYPDSKSYQDKYKLLAHPQNP
jgi:ankyrin repeat protein